jgi:NADPH2:quinone reductase
VKAIVARRVGGPEVLELSEVPDPEPRRGELLIKVRRAGVNFADLLATQGKYAASPAPPYVPGLEVSGEDSQGRPVMAILASGAYAERAVADPLLTFDASGLDLDEAAGYPLVTLTAYFGLHEMVRIRRGERVLVTAAAGGLGSTSMQVARALGAAQVVGVASSEEKRRFALDHGADRAIGYEDDVPEVDVVVETVGGDVFTRLLESMRPLSRMLLLGASSGRPPDIPGFDQLRRRNVAVLAFSFGMFRRAAPERVAKLAAPAIEMLRSGVVRPVVGRTFPLAEAAEAHRLLGGRQTVGKLLLAP